MSLRGLTAKDTSDSCKICYPPLGGEANRATANPLTGSLGPLRGGEREGKGTEGSENRKGQRYRRKCPPAFPLLK